jgi:putative endonuclease
MWYFYVVKCNDNSFYAGVTTELDRRVYEHNNTRRGAKYTRSRRPVVLIYSEECDSRSIAQKTEYSFKQLNRKSKERLISEKLLTIMSCSGGFNYA